MEADLPPLESKKVETVQISVIDSSTEKVVQIVCVEQRSPEARPDQEGFSSRVMMGQIKH